MDYPVLLLIVYFAILYSNLTMDTIRSYTMYSETAFEFMVLASAGLILRSFCCVVSGKYM